jgi:hypothetical protein
MLKLMLVSAATIMTVAGSAVTVSAPAQAQGVGVEIGPGGVRAYERRPYRPVVERRERRVIVEDEDEEVCHTEIRRRRTASGSIITRRVRICE